MHQDDHQSANFAQQIANDALRVIFQRLFDPRGLLPIVAAMVLMSVAPAAADKRVALVIGNGAYENVPHLPNPPHDAKDVADALQRSGFEVILGVDLDKPSMDSAAIRFARAARDADVALFYYSGHAMQYAGINYLAPIDAKLTDEADLRLLERVDDIVADLQRAKNLRILVLDSCRNNPLAEELKRSIGTTRGISISRGLAKIDNPEGLIVAYATQAGRTAEDGAGRNSPFTTAFLKYIETPEEIGTIFRKISADVYTQTKQAQLPELSLSLIGEFYLRGRVEARTSPEPVPPAPAWSEAAQAWAATKDTTSQAVLEDFIRQFGNTVYGSLAKARLQELKSAAQSRPAQSLEALVPETVPYIHDSDRAMIRNLYLSAPDHKALAISVTQIGFVSGQATDEAAKTAALASCQKTTDAGGSIAVGQRCELYALGNTVVYAGGHPSLPPKPWLVRNPAIERPFAVKDVPIVNENQRAGIAKCYPDVGLYSKALAISPRGSACYRNQQSTDEAIRRSLETCGSNGLPCMIVAVDDKFVVPIPTTMKAIGFFLPSSDTTLAADARDDVARRLASASGGWTAVAVGTNGQPGIAVKASGEQAALEAALVDCGKHDQGCHVIAIGPFLVEPKSAPQPSAGSGRTGSADPFMRDVVTDCDRLAAYPSDPDRPGGVTGVLVGKIDVVPALTACNGAMRQYPDVARFVFQAGRIANQQKDYVLARQYWEKAVAMGSDMSMVGLGLLYQYGFGVQQDSNEARRWFEKSAGAGIAGGMNALGFLYESGTGVAKDYGEARRWYEKAAAGGEFIAMRNLGNLYQNGNGVPQDKLAARQWYERAAAGGDDKSKDLLKTLDAATAPVQPGAGARPTGSADPFMRNVVTDCDRLAGYPWDPHGAIGVSGVLFGKIDIVPAQTACNQAMRQYPDVARFVFQAGRIANQQKDFALARQYWEKATAMGSESGMAGLAALYQYGLGVPQDYNEARRLYEKSAAAGIPGGTNGLGFLYETGAGVAKDYNEARRWYEKAAAVGEPNAMRNLGNIYQNGNGVPQDKLTARKWYEKAAAAGDDKSKELLKTLDAASAQAQPR